MNHEWQVQEAKQRFSELLRSTVDEGPQTVTRHGQPVAVVIDISAYRKLRGDDDFKEFLVSAPEIELDDIDRASDTSRFVELT